MPQHNHESHSDTERIRAIERPVLPTFFDATEFQASKLPLREYALHKEIALPCQPFVYNDISPTPLDPYSLRAQDFPYYEGASMYMHSNIIEKAKQVGLPTVFEAVALSEVDFQHAHRSERNSEAFGRLMQHLPYDITPHDAETIFRTRAGVAQIHEPALLLARVPQVKAIECKKATRFLDAEALAAAEEQFVIHGLYAANKNVREFSLDKLYTIQDAEKISLRDIRPELRDEISSEYQPTYNDSIIVLKWVQAELTVHGVAIEVVSRNSFIALPPNLYLDGIWPNIIHRTDTGDEFNIQPIDVTKYYRIKS